MDPIGGFTTHANVEFLNKIDIIQSCNIRLLAGDSSKVGIVLEEKIADFSDDVKFVVDYDEKNEKLVQIVEHYKDKVVLV